MSVANPVNRMVSRDHLLMRLDYCPDSGKFRWKAKEGMTIQDRRWNGRFAGKIAGNLDPLGYVRIRLDGQLLHAHRAAWMMMYGVISHGKAVDHINGQKDDNKASNLRLIQITKTTQHRHGARRDSASGLRGVRQDTRGRIVGEVTVNGKRHRKYFFSFADADLWCRRTRARLIGQDADQDLAGN